MGALGGCMGVTAPRIMPVAAYRPNHSVDHSGNGGDLLSVSRLCICILKEEDRIASLICHGVSSGGGEKLMTRLHLSEPPTGDGNAISTEPRTA